MKVRCAACYVERVDPLEQPSNTRSIPAAGDFWLCPQCGQLHRFCGSYTTIIDDADPVVVELFVRKAEDAELEQLEPELRVSLLAKRVEIIRQAVR